MPHLTPLHWITLPMILILSLSFIVSTQWWNMPPSWPPSNNNLSASTPFSKWHWK